MEKAKDILIEESQINKMWSSIFVELVFGEETCDLEIWKECIRRTYYLFYDSLEEDKIYKKYLDVLYMMHSIRMFHKKISIDFMAAQLVTEALLNVISGNKLSYSEECKISKGKLLVDGKYQEDVFYVIDIDNINLDEIIIGEGLMLI